MKNRTEFLRDMPVDRVTRGDGTCTVAPYADRDMWFEVGADDVFGSAGADGLPAPGTVVVRLGPPDRALAVFTTGGDGNPVRETRTAGELARGWRAFQKGELAAKGRRAYLRDVDPSRISPSGDGLEVRVFDPESDGTDGGRGYGILVVGRDAVTRTPSGKCDVYVGRENEPVPDYSVYDAGTGGYVRTGRTAGEVRDNWADDVSLAYEDAAHGRPVPVTGPAVPPEPHADRGGPDVYLTGFSRKLVRESGIDARDGTGRKMLQVSVPDPESARQPVRENGRPVPGRFRGKGYGTFLVPPCAVTETGPDTVDIRLGQAGERIGSYRVFSGSFDGNGRGIYTEAVRTAADLRALYEAGMSGPSAGHARDPAKGVVLCGVDRTRVRESAVPVRDGSGRHMMMVAVEDPDSARQPVRRHGQVVPGRFQPVGYGSFLVHPDQVRPSEGHEGKLDVHLGSGDGKVRGYRIFTGEYDGKGKGVYVGTDRTVDEVLDLFLADRPVPDGPPAVYTSRSDAVYIRNLPDANFADGPDGTVMARFSEDMYVRVDRDARTASRDAYGTELLPLRRDVRLDAGTMAEVYETGRDGGFRRAGELTAERVVRESENYRKRLAERLLREAGPGHEATMPRVEAWQVDLDPGRDYVRVTRGIGAGDDAAVARILVPDKEGFEAGGHPGRWAELFVARDGCRRLDDGAYEVDVCGENESVYGYVVSDDADGFRHSARTGDEIVARPWDPGPDCGKAPSRQPAGGEPDRSLTRALPSLSRRLEEEVVRRRLPDVPDAPDGSPGMEPGV